MPDSKHRIHWADVLAVVVIAGAVTALLLWSGCGGGMRIEFPPKSQVSEIEQIAQIEAVANRVARVSDEHNQPSGGDPWRSNLVWALPASGLVGYPVMRWLRLKFMNPSVKPTE